MIVKYTLYLDESGNFEDNGKTYKPSIVAGYLFSGDGLTEDSARNIMYEVKCSKLIFSNIDINSSKNGIHVVASNNRIDNCKTWYCSENGFYHERGNFNQINNCEAQENGTNGFYFKTIEFANISILSEICFLILFL